MQLPSSLVRKLDLRPTADVITSKAIDHFPLLVSERCLQGSESELVQFAAAQYESGYATQTATLTMPRKGFGPRPVALLAPIDRLLYEALTKQLAPLLPAPTRGSELWGAFSSFGFPGSSTSAKYVVTIDIAAAYEYVDHERLREELMLQTMDVATVDALISFLGEAFGRPRGLPQMLDSSDLLADTYLGMIERTLARQGFSVLRYADDFRVLADTWGSANAVIEQAAEAARDLGLVLSSEKTTIRLATTLKENQDELEAFVDKYFETARDDLRSLEYVFDLYGDIDEVELEPEEEETFEAAYLQILQDWASESAGAGNSTLNKVVGRSMRGLEGADTRLTNRLLTEIAFRQPIRTDAITRYIIARPEVDKNWATLKKLVKMERQSPWSKIWLIEAASQLGEPSQGKHKSSVVKWVRSQLDDSHETVRAQAAWFLAGEGSIDPKALAGLYIGATPITRPAISAALGRLGEESSSPYAKAMRGDNRLIAKSFDWGASQVS